MGDLTRIRTWVCGIPRHSSSSCATQPVVSTPGPPAPLSLLEIQEARGLRKMGRPLTAHGRAWLAPPTPDAAGDTQNWHLQWWDRWRGRRPGGAGKPFTPGSPAPLCRVPMASRHHVSPTAVGIPPLRGLGVLGPDHWDTLASRLELSHPSLGGLCWAGPPTCSFRHSHLLWAPARRLVSACHIFSMAPDICCPHSGRALHGCCCHCSLLTTEVARAEW